MVVILASNSPRRRTLLRRHGISFRVHPSRISENVRAPSPKALVKKLALSKALSVAKRFPNQVVLGADTVVVLGKRILGKPKGKQDAVRILNLLSGSRHRVLTGMALVRLSSGQQMVACETSVVKMRKLGSKILERAAKKHLDKAGAYAIQEKGDPFVEWVKGDYENVVGLPVKRVKQMLRNFQ